MGRGKSLGRGWLGSDSYGLGFRGYFDEGGVLFEGSMEVGLYIVEGSEGRFGGLLCLGGEVERVRV